jgi:hypothetical protein
MGVNWLPLAKTKESLITDDPPSAATSPPRLVESPVLRGLLRLRQPECRFGGSLLWRTSSALSLVGNEAPGTGNPGFRRQTCPPPLFFFFLPRHVRGQQVEVDSLSAFPLLSVQVIASISGQAFQSVYFLLKHNC